MHLIDFPLPDLFLYFSIFLSSATLLFALLTAPWKALLKVQQRQHLFFAAIIVLVILWSIKITWVKGFFLHPMGITAVTIIFGWRLAIILGALVILAFELLHYRSWDTMPVDFIFTVIVPATITYAMVHLIHSWRSRNLFLFLLGAGFIGAMLGFLTDLGIIVLLAAMLDQQLFLSRLAHEFPIVIMLLNVEGFLNGAVVTALSVFAPHLVKSFDDVKYLG